MRCTSLYLTSPAACSPSSNGCSASCRTTSPISAAPAASAALASGAFPTINVGSTPTSIEVYAFAPGLDPAKLDIQLVQGLLSISGERESAKPGDNGTLSVYANERFAGRFKRTVNLSKDADPDKVELRIDNDTLLIEGEIAQDAPEHLEAVYAEVRLSRYRRAFSLSSELDSERIDAQLRDGVLNLRIPRHAHAQPRKMDVKVA